MFQTRRRISEETEQMEIVDEQGVPVGRVTRPTDPRPFGPDKGTVYLQRELPPAA